MTQCSTGAHQPTGWPRLREDCGPASAGTKVGIQRVQCPLPPRVPSMRRHWKEPRAGFPPPLKSQTVGRQPQQEAPHPLRRGHPVLMGAHPQGGPSGTGGLGTEPGRPSRGLGLSGALPDSSGGRCDPHASVCRRSVCAPNGGRPVTVGLQPVGWALAWHLTRVLSRASWATVITAAGCSAQKLETVMPPHATHSCYLTRPEAGAGSSWWTSASHLAFLRTSGPS